MKASTVTIDVKEYIDDRLDLRREILASQHRLQEKMNDLALSIERKLCDIERRIIESMREEK